MPTEAPPTLPRSIAESATDGLGVVERSRGDLKTHFDCEKVEP